MSEKETASVLLERVVQAQIGVDTLVWSLRERAEKMTERSAWLFKNNAVLAAFRPLLEQVLERGASEEDLENLLGALKESRELAARVGQQVLAREVPNRLLRRVIYMVPDLRKRACERLMKQDPRTDDLLCVFECTTGRVLASSKERPRWEMHDVGRVEFPCYTHEAAKCQVCAWPAGDEVRMRLRQEAHDRFHSSTSREADLIRLLRMDVSGPREAQMILADGASEEGLYEILVHASSYPAAIVLQAAKQAVEHPHVSESSLYFVLTANLIRRVAPADVETLQGLRDLAATRLLAGTPAGSTLQEIIRHCPRHADEARTKLLARGVERDRHACMAQYGVMEDQAEELDRKNEADWELLQSYWEAAYREVREH